MSKRDKTDAPAPSPAPTQAGPSVRPLAATDDARTPADPSTPHAVENLALTFGATPEEIALVTDAMAPEAIRDAAEEAGTPRTSDEAFRVGDAARLFYGGASSSALGALRMQPAVVRVMVTCAAQASACRRQGQLQLTRRRGASSAAEVAQGSDLQRARASRDQFAEALRGVHGGNPVMLERVRDAEQPGRVGHADAGPGRALASLVALGREALADPSQRERAALWGVDAAWLDQCARLAGPALEATAEQKTPATPAVHTAPELHWRGLALILLRRVLGAFASGSAAHLAVPAIDPLYLRSAFAPKRAAAKKGEGAAKKRAASDAKAEPTKTEATKAEPTKTEAKGAAGDAKP